MAAVTGTPTSYTQASSSSGSTLSVPSGRTGGNFYGIVSVTISASTVSVSSIDWAGSSMSLLSRTGGAGGAYWVEEWGLVNPPGSGTITVTLSASAGRHSAIATMFNDVDQATPQSGAAGNYNASATTTISVNITSATGDLVYGVVSLQDDDVTGYTDGAGQTLQSNVVCSAGVSNGCRTRTYTEAGATTVTINGTWSTSTTAAIAKGVSLKHSAYSGGGSSIAAISSGYHQRGLH